MEETAKEFVFYGSHHLRLLLPPISSANSVSIPHHRLNPHIASVSTFEVVGVKKIVKSGNKIRKLTVP